MIQVLLMKAEGLVMPYAIGDLRAASRGEWLVDQIVATGSLVLRKVGGDRAGEMAAHRYLSSPYASVEAIIGTAAARTVEQCAGRRIVVMEDTTEVNFAGRAARRQGFGPGGNGRDPGFFIHPVIAADVSSEAVIGPVWSHIWTRSSEPVAPRRSRTFEEKESARWLAGCSAAAALLRQTTSLTMIADREGDIFELFARCPAGLDLIVRAGQDRALDGEGRLFEALSGAPVLMCHVVRVAPRGPGDKGRKARVELRACTVRIRRPKSSRSGDGPDVVELTLVEAREIDAPVPMQPLLWRLLTTHKVEEPEDASEIIELYRLRWRIEQVFRTLKSDGLRLEDSQITKSEPMFRLAAIALIAAVRTIQLVDARDGSSRPATDVVDACFSEALGKMSRKLEGKTQRQKNPHPPDSLAWLAWITARLGGWNCYYKPPGPKTMRDGWNRLAAQLAGYALAKADADA